MRESDRFADHVWSVENKIRLGETSWSGFTEKNEQATGDSVGVQARLASFIYRKFMGVFDLRVRPAAGAVEPLRPWVGDGAKSGRRHFGSLGELHA